MSVLFVDKPSGITSFDVIRELRKKGFPRKMWHAGTLDPLASGLMILCTEKDTKKISEFVGLEKSYQTTIDFSRDSDTWDKDKREREEQYKVVTPESKKEKKQKGIEKDGNVVVAPSLSDIQETLDTIVGTYMLPLTPFSAKKVDGKKLYEYAREGNPIFMDIPMTVISYEIIDYSFPLLELKLTVGSWTYIRSIAHWLGQQFGLGGILTALRRTSIGDYDIKRAKPLDALSYESDSP
jgi:tRNA pseudouridine55 synthase